MTDLDVGTTLRIEALRAATRVSVPGHMTVEGRASEFLDFLSAPGHLSGYRRCVPAIGCDECVLAAGHEEHEFGEVGSSPVTTHVDRWGRHWGIAAPS